MPVEFYSYLISPLVSIFNSQHLLVSLNRLCLGQQNSVFPYSKNQSDLAWAMVHSLLPLVIGHWARAWHEIHSVHMGLVGGMASLCKGENYEHRFGKELF